MADGAAPGAGFSVTLNRTFRAPVDLVFDCFTKAEHLARWWGPYGFDAPQVRADARPGGELFIEMRGPTHDPNPCHGEFIEIDRPRRLVFELKAFPAEDGTFHMHHRTVCQFEPVGESTRLVLTTTVIKSSAELAAALGGMKTGWGQSLEKLGDLVGGGGKLDVELADRQIIMTRAFDASREAIWQAHVDRDLFAQWWPAGASLNIIAFDVRPGGKWLLEETGGDGATHTFQGEFQVVEAPSRLVQTMAFDAHEAVTIETVLTEEWGRTLLTRTITCPSNPYRDGMFGTGMEPRTAASYDRLAELVAGSAARPC